MIHSLFACFKGLPVGWLSISFILDGMTSLRYMISDFVVFGLFDDFSFPFKLTVYDTSNHYYGVAITHMLKYQTRFEFKMHSMAFSTCPYSACVFYS